MMPLTLERTHPVALRHPSQEGIFLIPLLEGRPTGRVCRRHFLIPLLERGARRRGVLLSSLISIHWLSPIREQTLLPIFLTP